MYTPENADSRPAEEIPAGRSFDDATPDAESRTKREFTEKTRRRFINTLIGGGFLGWLGTIVYPVMAFLKPPDVPEVNVNSVRAGLATAFPVNSSEIVQFGRLPVILVRLETGEFRAFAGTCTHLDCIVQYRDDIEHIWCACHNGHYDLNGRNISGPPPLPLASFSVNVVDDEIIISRPPQVI